MSKKKFRKQPYIVPLCRVIQTENESFICGVSVRPNPGDGSGHSPWDEKNHDGGTGFIGDESNIAPAKQGGLWNYDNYEEDY